MPRHLGGPDDDHYAVLGVQPIEVIEAWDPTWPDGIRYHLGEAIEMISRCGTKGNAVRDLRKASFLLARACEKISQPNNVVIPDDDIGICGDCGCKKCRK